MTFDPDRFLRDKRANLAAAQQRLARAQHDVEIAQAELRGAEDVLAQIGSALPRRSSSPQAARPGEPASKGRQPGAISKVWRAILADLAEQYPEGFRDEDAARTAQSHGINMRRPSEARRRLEHFQTFNYVEIDGDVTRVTQHAADHFGFAATIEKKEPPEGGSSFEGEAGSQEGFPRPAPTGSTPVSSSPQAGKLPGGDTLSGSFPHQFPLPREKGG